MPSYYQKSAAPSFDSFETADDYNEANTLGTYLGLMPNQNPICNLAVGIPSRVQELSVCTDRVQEVRSALEGVKTYTAPSNGKTQPDETVSEHVKISYCWYVGTQWLAAPSAVGQIEN